MRFLPLLFTVFIDSLGFGLAFPIFSALIINPDQSLLPEDTSLAVRGLIYGFLISSFCIGQFFGGPVLGALSDRKGRKKILLFTLALAFATYALAGIGIGMQSVVLLLVSRVVGGVAAGNFTIAQSVIVDCSNGDDKAKNFGLLGMAWGLGFIIGPFLAGKLSDPAFFPGSDLRTPFWFAAALCLLNIAVLRKLPETLSQTQMTKMSFLAGVHHLKKAFGMVQVRGLFLVMFIFSLGWGFFTEFSPIFLMQRYHFSLDSIGNFYACIGLWIAISQGALIRPLLKRFSPQVLLGGGLVGLGVILSFMLLVDEGWVLFALAPFLAFPESLIYPTASTLVSNMSDKEAQGEVLGIHNSIQWAAIGFSPLFSGSFVALYPHLPITVAIGAMFLAFIVLFLVFRRGKKKEIVLD